MGGRNSGPVRTVADWPVFDECLVVAIHRLVRAGILKEGTPDLRIDWASDDPEVTNSVNVKRVASLPNPSLALSYWVADGHAWQERHQRVTLTHSALRRGQNWWFVCPHCGRRARVLALPPGGESFACRVCHQIASPALRDRHGRGEAGEEGVLGVD